TILQQHLTSTLFPYTTLFRSVLRTPSAKSSSWKRTRNPWMRCCCGGVRTMVISLNSPTLLKMRRQTWMVTRRSGSSFHVLHDPRSEEHTSELQSRFDLVCRLL